MLYNVYLRTIFTNESKNHIPLEIKVTGSHPLTVLALRMGTQNPFKDSQYPFEVETRDGGRSIEVTYRSALSPNQRDKMERHLRSLQEKGCKADWEQPVGTKIPIPL